jgi:hypothetical protein
MFRSQFHDHHQELITVFVQLLLIGGVLIFNYASQTFLKCGGFKCEM